MYYIKKVGRVFMIELKNIKFGKNYFIIKGFVVSSIIPIIILVYTVFIALLVTTSSISKISKVKSIDVILNK